MFDFNFFFMEHHAFTVTLINTRKYFGFDPKFKHMFQYST